MSSRHGSDTVPSASCIAPANYVFEASAAIPRSWISPGDVVVVRPGDPLFPLLVGKHHDRRTLLAMLDYVDRLVLVSEQGASFDPLELRRQLLTVAWRPQALLSPEPHQRPEYLRVIE